jgi:hypothetical protein
MKANETAMKKLFLFALLALVCTTSQARRQITFDFPQSGGASGQLYYFSGSRVDSVAVELDGRGSGVLLFPQGDYRGMVYFYLPGAGGAECIVAEEELHLSSREKNFDTRSLAFGRSEENRSIASFFDRRSLLLERRSWLEAGLAMEANRRDSHSLQLLEKQLKDNEREWQSFRDSLLASPLYAARFVLLSEFMGELYDGLQSADTSRLSELREAFESRLDLETLYSSGQLWNEILRCYPHVLDLEGSLPPQTAALSVRRTLRRLSPPVQTAFLLSAVEECDRVNRTDASRLIVRDFALDYPEVDVTAGPLSPLLGLFRTETGKQAPALEGLSDPSSRQPMLILFYDDGCSHCREEIEWLQSHYGQLHGAGYRVVSVSADTDEKQYEALSSEYPWADRLCDFQGFRGANFRSYGILSTPVIVLTDADGIITGRFAKVGEALEKLKMEN